MQSVSGMRITRWHELACPKVNGSDFRDASAASLAHDILKGKVPPSQPPGVQLLHNLHHTTVNISFCHQLL